MKIKIENKGTSFSIHLPLFVVNLIPSIIVNGLFKRYSNFENEEFIKNFDFSDIKKSLKILKNFKGLNILELKSRSGDNVIITA